MPSDAAVLLTARGARAFGDGFVSVLLPVYLASLGLDPVRIGAVATATLLGSASLTLAVGLVANRWKRRTLLTGAGLLMAGTGVAFAGVHSFWPLLIVAFAGTLNPSTGDVSVFLPLEQTVLPQTVSASQRTGIFSYYSLVGSLLGAMGSLSAGVPALIAARGLLGGQTAIEAMFLLYGALGLVALALYQRLTPAIEIDRSVPAVPLGPSKRIVYTMAGLFAVDAFAGGLTLQSLLALWLFERFALSTATAGTIFFITGLCSAASFLAAPPLARRFGLVNTMVFSHLPSNVLMVLVAFAPNLPIAIALLAARASLSQMDVPTRRSYIMAVVTPEERPAASSVTTAPRGIATSIAPILSGYLLGLTTFGWPLIVCGALKIGYDLSLLKMFRSVKPPEES